MLEGDHSYQRRQEKTLPNNEPSSEQRDNTSSRFKKRFREKYPRMYGFFFSETPIYIRHFFGLLVSLGILGGFLALTVPLWRSWAETPKTNCIEFIIGWVGSFLSSFIPPSDADKYPDGKVIADVRLHILYITGGIIAILTLLQTNWKNQVDHRKVEDDIQKNKNDHIRQVHAERRKRYTTAVEQLASEKAAVRLGGVYTLVGLVDEWLDDSKLLSGSSSKDSDEQKKEGQIIINNLCAYIKSPVIKETVPSENHLIRQEEQRIRQAILHEVHVRLSSKNFSLDTEEHEAGPWSKFTFDFSSAEFFYPVDFSNSFFEEKINFTESIFEKDAMFKNTKFKESAIFNSAKFLASSANNCASFENAKISEITDFSSSVFTMPLIFKNATFNGELRLDKSQFILVTPHTEHVYYYSEPILDHETGNVHMTLSAEMHLETQNKEYHMASFSGATFNNGFTMQGARSEGIINFVSTSGEVTKFSYKPNPLKYNFDLHQESVQIDTEEITAPDGRKFDVPKGCAIFDPDNPSESLISNFLKPVFSVSEQETGTIQKINMLFP